MLIRTIERRAAMLAASDNESARLCAAEALGRLADDAAGRPFTGAITTRAAIERARLAGLPTSWVESAAAWITRGAQHAYGYQLPEGW